MKKILVYITFLFLAFIAGIIYSNKQNEKHYQAACILNDIVNMSLDGSDINQIYDNVMDNLYYYNVSFTKEDLNNYHWCY